MARKQADTGGQGDLFLPPDARGPEFPESNKPGRPLPELPPGFLYEPELLTMEEEAELVSLLERLPFEAFDFHGFKGKRRTVSFGRHYDFGAERLKEAAPIPGMLLPVRERAARFAGVRPAMLQHVLVTEYPAAAGIGWHRDKAVFGKVIGISLLSNCNFRFRRRLGSTWERISVPVDRRSAYLLSGAARELWEHSIPPVPSLRYSVTFRELKER